ncbi:ZIP family metal transporter [Halalkalibacterium halodurans]|nr:ZIP family metal transporter [Halalkalibacterium halodurans]MED3647343.1 ZIP family metal transporter [Halalkalibacterium halodurans]
MIHTFFDGLSIVASFAINSELGFVVLIGVLLHKIPDGLTISSIVFASLKSKKKAIGAAVLLGLSTIVGATAALFLTELVSLQSSLLAISLSLTAGIFLYIALTDLLPVVNATEDRPIILFFWFSVKRS